MSRDNAGQGVVTMLDEECTNLKGHFSCYKSTDRIQKWALDEGAVR